MSILAEPLSAHLARLPRAVVTGAIVALMLLVEWIVPARSAGSGMMLLSLAGAGFLFLFFGVRTWPALLILACYAPFAAYLRLGGLSNLQSLAKDAFALGIVGLWAMGAIIKRQKLVRTPLDLALLLFVVVGLLNVLRGPSLLRGMLGFKILFTYVPIYFLVTQRPPSKEQLRWLLWALVATGAVVALYGLLQYAQVVPVPRVEQNVGYEIGIASSNFRWGKIRAFSTFSHTSVFALFLATCLALELGLERSASWKGKVALGAILLLTVAAVPTTLSRTGWIAALLVVLTLTLLSSGGKTRAKVLIAIALVTLALGLAGPTTQRTLSWTGSAEDESFQERPSLLYWAARMTFVERPEGCGMGVLPDAAALTSRVTGAYEPANTCFWQGYPLQSADTVAFSIGVQMGALGYLLYLLIFVLIWKHGLTVYRDLHDRFLKGVAAGILGYLAAITLTNFFFSSPSAYPIVDFYFWLFVGVLMSLKRIEAAKAV